jgi:hypothetical protein
MLACFPCLKVFQLQAPAAGKPGAGAPSERKPHFVWLDTNPDLGNGSAALPIATPRSQSFDPFSPRHGPPGPLGSADLYVDHESVARIARWVHNFADDYGKEPWSAQPTPRSASALLCRRLPLVSPAAEVEVARNDIEPSRRLAIERATRVYNIATPRAKSCSTCKLDPMEDATTEDSSGEESSSAETEALSSMSHAGASAAATWDTLPALDDSSSEVAD